MKKQFILSLLIFLVACQPVASTPIATEAVVNMPIPAATATPEPMPQTMWISQFVPDQLRDAVLDETIPLVDDIEAASLVLNPSNDPDATAWTYALVAPFPTIRDGVTLDELKTMWQEGTPPDPINENAPEEWNDLPLWMAESTRMALTWIWGATSRENVRIVPSDELLERAWEQGDFLAIIPFEEIQPRWKVLTIDGQSPLHNDFVSEEYPLTVNFAWKCAEPCPVTPPELPAFNRDPDKLTVMVLTGVTALVRATAYKMEEEGLTYPARDIGDLLRSADITHISNEIPFDPYCPPPNRGQKSLQFCSDPKYIELLEYVGTDLIELTGNHFQDRGSAATLYTLDMYDELGIPYYGGGRDLEDARDLTLLEHNGNKFAFIGCNPVGPDFAWARDDGWPGAAPCDYEYMTEQIATIRAKGYLPIATFQYFEYYSPEIRPWQGRDFRSLADAGAVIVSGSQAHAPQVKEFYGESFIDYGLGNLFFDQMNHPSGDITRQEFIDRHVFYDGQYIGTELITAMLMDYARPELMSEEDRAVFLNDIFDASGWLAMDYVPPVEEPVDE